MQESLKFDESSVSKVIDHTCLKPAATEFEIAKLCDEALEFQFKCVCVEQKWLSLVVSRLKRSNVKPITVISFPHGNDETVQKCAQVKIAKETGALEIDMVLNRDLLKAKDYAAVLHDIEAVVMTAGKLPVKVILETSELSLEEKIIACALSKAARAQFVKTSTGFSKAGASEQDIRIMRNIVGPEMGVKASGGIRTLSDVLKMIGAGADRVGSSSSVSILKEIRAR